METVPCHNSVKRGWVWSIFCHTPTFVRNVRIVTFLTSEMPIVAVQSSSESFVNFQYYFISGFGTGAGMPGCSGLLAGSQTRPTGERTSVDSL